MSLKSNLLARSMGLAEEEAPPPPAARPPGIAPAKHYLSAMRQSEAEEKLARYEGSTPVRRLDPKKVRPSRFKNRHDDSFKRAEFADFQAEIAAAGGNVVPIRVRPVANSDEFELIYGHRRHRACLNLGIEVLAEIVEVSDQQLYLAMTRENVGKNDLSPYEWGLHYKRGLAEVYTTQAQLAAESGRHQTHVAKALQITELPAEVIDAFPSPLDIQFRWADRLAERLGEDREELLERARELAARKGEPGLTAAKVFAELAKAPKPVNVEIKRAGKVVAAIKQQGGVTTVRFAKGALNASKVRELKKALSDLLGSEPSS